MFTISKKFAFSASHQLVFLSATHPNHQCARLHGHNYEVEFVLRSEFLNNANGSFVRDYGELTPVKLFIDSALDHQHLNTVLDSPTGEATTAERMAEMLFWKFRTQLPELYAVRVSETPKTWAEYCDHHNAAHRYE